MQLCCLAFVGINHFKKVNERHGHLLGDQVLGVITRMPQDSLRLCNLVYRFGREEFMTCLPNTSPEVAGLVLERICKKNIGLTHVNIDGAETFAL